MAQKAIREADGKNMIARLLKEYTNGTYTIDSKFLSIGPANRSEETADNLQMACERKTRRQTRSTHQKTREKQAVVAQRGLERCGEVDQRTDEQTCDSRNRDRDP